MRMFRARHATAEEGPVYCCQEDGMVGLGCGARSYTRGLHYSSEYAVAARGVRQILDAYVARPEESFGLADHGYQLDADDQRRRYAIQSLLSGDGLRFAAYERRFHTAVLDDLPMLRDLEGLGLAVRIRDGLFLTPSGIERSDAIGPWLYSEEVRRVMEGYEWR
jgi:oxygen-independent coproporphyrinogen-3 oxidase